MSDITLGRFLFNKYMMYVASLPQIAEQTWKLANHGAWERAAQDTVQEHLVRTRAVCEEPPFRPNPSKTAINPNWMDITRDIATS